MTVAMNQMNTSALKSKASVKTSGKAAGKGTIAPTVDSDLGYVRSTVLSVFLLFSFASTDARNFLRLLESVDVKYSQTVNVKEFARRFCGEYSVAFSVITGAFSDLSFPAKKRTLYEVNEKDEEREKLRKESRKNPSYSQFTCFLLFFMTIPDEEVAKWLYWVVFGAPGNPGKPVNQSNLCALADSLWGVSKTEEQRKASENRRTKITTILDGLKMSDFNGRLFQICDWKTTLEWTTPLLKLRLHLRESFLGDIFWNTAGVSMLNVSKNIHQAIGKLNESPIIVPNCLIPREDDENERGVKDEKPAGDERKVGRRKSQLNTLETTPQNPQIILEKLMKKDRHERYWRAVSVTVDGRKVARKDLRSFLRIFRRYHELPIDDISEEFSDLHSRPFTDAILLIARAVTKWALGASELAQKLRSIPEEKAIDVKNDSVKLPICEFLSTIKKEKETKENAATIDLEVKYKEALKMPLPKLYSLSELVRKQAIELMEDVEEDLQVVVVVPDIDNEGGEGGNEGSEGSRRGEDARDRIYSDEGDLKFYNVKPRRNTGDNGDDRGDGGDGGESDPDDHAWAADEYADDYEGDGEGEGGGEDDEEEGVYSKRDDWTNNGGDQYDEDVDGKGATGENKASAGGGYKNGDGNGGGGGGEGGDMGDGGEDGEGGYDDDGRDSIHILDSAQRALLEPDSAKNSSGNNSTREKHDEK